ncbi:hypothetical protein EJB05_43811, partial [Eragrostis curvula]
MRCQLTVFIHRICSSRCSSTVAAVAEQHAEKEGQKGLFAAPLLCVSLKFDGCDIKNAHLKALQGAEERLQLLKADLMDYDSIVSTVAGCEGVFHVASPVPSSRSNNPEVNLSVASILNAHCSDWYFVSKTLAEREAFAYAAKTGLDIVTICPSLVIGPLMQPTVNASSKFVLGYFKGDRETVENRLRNVVDVRDVADPLLLTYEKPEAFGRHICSSHLTKVSEMITILKSLCPSATYPKSCVEVEDNIITCSSEKLQTLGWTFRPIEETLRDSVESYKAFGILN